MATSSPFLTPRDICVRPWLTAIFFILIARAIPGSNGADGAETSLKEMSGVAGDDVFLPCDVDLLQCGEFHSIKWYKDSQRVFVFSELANLERPEGPLIDRAKLHYSANESEARLEIDKVQLTDEALYRCEITYLEVNEGCSIVQQIQLSILAAPKFVEVLLEDNKSRLGQRNVTQVGPYNEGTSVALVCRAGGGRPVPTLIWWNGTHNMGGEVITAPEEGGAITGINRLEVALTRHDLGSRWQCQVNSPALSTPMVANVEIDVHVSPISVELSGVDGPVVEGQSVSLLCRSVGARPAASLAWFNGSDPWNSLSEDNFAVQTDGTYETQSRLTFTASRRDNGRRVVCQASNPVLTESSRPPLSTTLTLEVHYPPIVTVEPENITVNESMDVLLFCKYDANPITLTRVQWLKDGQELVLTPEKFEGGTVDQPSLLLKNASRTDTGAYTCHLDNGVGLVEADNVAFVYVQHPPVVRLSMTPETPINEMERPNITLTCEILSGQPSLLLAVRWYLDGELLKELPECMTNNTLYTAYDEDFCDIDPSKLLLENVGRSFQGNYSCEGMNAAGWSELSEEEELIIYYPPGKASISYEPSTVVKGQVVQLTCNVDDPGQPAVQKYKWMRNGREILNEVGANWTINPVTLKTQANYTCVAVNEAGEGEPADLELDVLAAPAFIDRLPPYHGALVDAADVSISCRVECAPLCSVEWLKNGKALEPSPLYSIKTNVLPADSRTNDFESVVSTLVWNLSAWPNGMFDRVEDNANYTCVSTSNMAGSGVSSTTYFRVEYPPENITISETVLSVVEGDVPNRLVCSAQAYPQPTYYWQYEKQIISTGEILFLDYPIMREKAGDYSCVAHNRHGNITAKTVIDVQYKPECTITQKESEGKIQLYCDVIANPARVDFIWMFNNSTLTEGISYKGLQSVLTLTGTSPYLGTYYCFTNNSVGMSIACEMDVTGGGLLAKLGDDSLIIIIAAVAAAVVVIIIICIVIVCLCRRKRTEDKYHTSGKMEERENPDGHANLNSVQVQPVHKWPIRPGVHVHINGLHTLSSNASTVNGFSFGTAQSGTCDSGSESTKSVVPIALRNKSYSARKLTRAKRTTNVGTSTNNSKSLTRSISQIPLPQHSALAQVKAQIYALYGRDFDGTTILRPSSGTNAKNESPSTPENAETLRITEVEGRDVQQNIPDHNLETIGTQESISRKRKKPGSAPARPPPVTRNNNQANDLDDNDKFYENLPFHGLQGAPNKAVAQDVNQTCSSRPASQMSQANSSGYGSTRSNSGVMLDPAHLKRPQRCTTFGSLRHNRDNKTIPTNRSQLFLSMRGSVAGRNVSDSSDSPAQADNNETSLTAPEQQQLPPVPVPGRPPTPAEHNRVPEWKMKTAHQALVHDEPNNNGPHSLPGVQSVQSQNQMNQQSQEPHSFPSAYPITDTDALPLESVLERHEAPVPAPRFQTLKRHAYQNIPLPNKQKPTSATVDTASQPYKPLFSDLEYADVDYRAYGPTNYKRASMALAAERKAKTQAEAQGIPARPPRETRI